MLSCIMIGDSIAVGVGQARPECETIAQVGITSARYVATLLPPARVDVDTAVISLGVNDDTTVDTLENLRQVRSRVHAQAVVWLLPGLKDNVRDMIRTVAAEHGDRTLDTRPQVGRDHLHPTGTGYEVIAANVIGPREGEEVAAYVPSQAERLDRPLAARATPRDRIRRLRSIRQAQLGHSQVQPIHVELRPGQPRAGRLRPGSLVTAPLTSAQHASARGSHAASRARADEMRAASGAAPRTVARAARPAGGCLGTDRACQPHHRSRV